eukprot:7389013-Prymnesium_polylepis.7
MQHDDELSCEVVSGVLTRATILGVVVWKSRESGGPVAAASGAHASCAECSDFLPLMQRERGQNTEEAPLALVLCVAWR